MTDETKTTSLKQFLISQVDAKGGLLDSEKAQAIEAEINAIADEFRKFTDWEKKNSTQAEFKIRLRSVLEMHNLPTKPAVLEGILRRVGVTSTPKSYWFVGATYGRGRDQTKRFVKEGIWQNGYEDKYLELVKAMRPGDLIAIKASYTRKLNLPFDNRGQTVSVMGIKVTGMVTKNHGDGRFVDVEWDAPLDPIKEWFFYTNRGTVWRVVPGEWMPDAMIDFAFNDEAQDVDRFRNAPYWKERFGDSDASDRRFLWSRFYSAVADGLVAHQESRGGLLAFVKKLADRFGLSYIMDKQLVDIDPFTVLGLFNRKITDENRKAIAGEVAHFLGVDESVPESFEGIPILNNQKSWFFGFEEKRDPDDIDSIWEVFARAIQFSDSGDSDARSNFCDAYDRVAGQYGIGWNLTMALYWIRPWSYLTLDGQSRLYIARKLGLEIGMNGPKGRCSASDYLRAMDELEIRFQEDAYPVHSFPDLSLAAWFYKDSDPSTLPNEIGAEQDDGTSGEDDEDEIAIAPIEPYLIDDIVSDGAFVGRENLAEMLGRLRTKKNLILQGAPGTGKTWLAKRLAFALIGQKDESRLRAVQFHPNLTYEDFVRGWRPSGDGKLALIDGPLLEMIKAAKKDATTRYVIVIEEINRGNPAQIFGEMLTLMEADKRTPDEALELSYRRSDGERVFIPDNLYVIGTMNIADRSLALVDLALRRRFAYIGLEPTFGESWRNWVHSKAGIDMAILEQIEQRLLDLNSEIENDKNLGAQFRVGHSYVTPAFSNKISDATKWYKGVVDSEIGPLLDEYWFDDLDRARKAREALVAGM